MGGCILVAIVTTAMGEWETPRCGYERIVLIVQGFSGFVNGVLVVFSLRIVTTFNFALLKTNTVFFAFIIEFFVIKKPPYWMSVVGAALIIFSSTVMITIKRFKIVKKRNKYVDVDKICEDRDSNASDKLVRHVRE